MNDIFSSHVKSCKFINYGVSRVSYFPFFTDNFKSREISSDLFSSDILICSVGLDND